MDLSSYISVSTHVFAEIEGPLTFDVYLRLGREKFTKIFSRGIPIEMDRLNSYVKKGIQNFHVHKEDRRRLAKVTRELLEDYLDDKGFDEAAAQSVLDQAAERALEEVFTLHRLDPDTFATTHLVVKSYISIAKSAPSILPKVLKLAKRKKDILRHSILTSIFSTLLARTLKPDDMDFWYNAGLAGLLHDVGLAQLPPRLDEHAAEMNPELKKILHQHSKISAEVVRIEELPDAVDEAIRAHHENWDGSGFPNGIKSEEIPLLARIVALTEQFASLINPPAADGVPLNPTLAILALKKGGKVDPTLIESFTQLLKLE